MSSAASSSTSSLPDNICANCGKGEECSGDLKSCTACQLVKYCNRDCQIAHRLQHKKACKKRATELYDEKLFNEHPPREYCPICILPMPLNLSQSAFHPCCGKSICNGCIYAMTESLCAFCRTPGVKSDEEELQQVNKLIENGNAKAFFQLGGYYRIGTCGLPQDHAKANELHLKGGELGCAGAYSNLGNSYSVGRGVAIDKKKAKHYYELAAMNGDVAARHNLGMMEGQAGNDQRAMKHLMISASDGHKKSLDMVKKGFMTGHVTKEQYANTLREYEKSQDEMNSDARDKAAIILNFNNRTELTGELSSLNIGSNESNNEENITICAACGKEGGDSIMNSCSKCDLVVYCNASCKKKHRSRHKKKCDQRLAELFDEKLFKEHPPREDCPICFLPMPLDLGQSAFESCCGKLICNGCSHPMRETGGENMKLCPFCKTPNAESDEEEVRRTEKLMERGDAHAFNQLAGCYAQKIIGMPQDWAKANELYLKAGEFGCAVAYYNLGNAYYYGNGVEIDMKKAKHYYELAAMNGDVAARHDLGCMEGQAGNPQRAFKHYILAASAGYEKSLNSVKKGYTVGFVTKDEYANALQAYQKSQDEMKSDIRDKALAARLAAESYDEMFFKEHHPPREDCPICFLPLPLGKTQTTFQSCCGKTICDGCIYTIITEDKRRGKKEEEINACAFCRTLFAKSAEEEIQRLEKLIEKGNAAAFYILAGTYESGTCGLPQDRAKANELYLKAGELGHAEAYYNLGCSYRTGDGVEIDTKKAKQYWELAAMNGSEQARHNLGCMERQTGNDQRVKKHFLLAARAGHKGSLENIKQGFMKGLVTKEEYANTLREYQKSQDEMKSEARDKARAFRNRQR